MKTLAAVFLVLLGGMAAACRQETAPDTRAADEQAIRATEAEWSKAGAAKDLDRFLSFYTEDASVLAPNAPVANGKEAIRSALSGLFAAPGFSLAFESNRLEVARSGDLAYSQGAYTLTMNDAKGSPITDRGKYVTVWKKQAEGSWKALSDAFSSDLPLAAPPGK